MLFADTIENWRDWGRVFQSIPAFTPLAKEIFRREALPWQELSPSLPAPTAYFGAGFLC